MLKLVVNNKQRLKKDIITCRNSCELFDNITESCSIKQKVKVDNPYEASRCGHFLHKKPVNKKAHFKATFIGEEEDFIIDDEDVFHELLGNNINTTESTYPSIPDCPSRREDATWYVSPCGTYGCWIINHYRKPLSVPLSKDQAEKGWNSRVYKSPFPLHDHKSSLSLASRMAWMIDDDGYGQYALLVNGKLSTLSSPRPAGWKK